MVVQNKIQITYTFVVVKYESLWAEHVQHRSSNTSSELLVSSVLFQSFSLETVKSLLSSACLEVNGFKTDVSKAILKLTPVVKDTRIMVPCWQMADTKCHRTVQIRCLSSSKQ